jgi:hypothetical protein
MSISLRSRRQIRRSKRATAWLHLESLETRFVLTGPSWPGLLSPVAETEPNDTLDVAQALGDLSVTGRAEVVGNISNSATGAGNVDWYSFTLTSAANIHLATLDQQGGSPLVSVLSLYNDDTPDTNDPQDPMGHRLLAQDDGAAHGGDASIDRLLGAGTYYVAVSGSGNRYFHPMLAGSGYAGSTGAYGLLMTASDAGISASDGPTVLTADPAPGSALAISPLVIRVDFSSALDPATFVPGTNIRLIYNPNGTFGDGNDQDININALNFSALDPVALKGANELQIFPGTALLPGYYKLFLAGDSTSAVPFLASPGAAPKPLGQNTNNPNGADYTMTFQINGIQGVVGATTTDDTLSAARQLGDITSGGIVQVAGAIGTDPTDPNPLNTGGVDIYQFHIGGSGRFAFTAEVFAGRIGSPLDPALTLFQLGSDGQLHLIDANDNTSNPAQTTDGHIPLYTDAALFDGLQAGDYFIVVSAAGNLPDPTQPWQPGMNNGIFDPTQTHSATPSSAPPGVYVLNLAAQSDNQAPTVLAVTPSNNSTLTGPPTQITVQFSKGVNLRELAFLAYQQASANLSSVYVHGPDGTAYYPRFISYDATTNTATFLMLDALPPSAGVYQLHLSGALGLTDFAGNPLVGNDPSGDYVVTFSVNGPARGSNGNPLQWLDQEPNDDPAHPQVIGVLFPHELAGQSQVTITRDFSQNPSAAPADTADYYEIQVLQNCQYQFVLNGSTPPGVRLTLLDALGNPVPNVSGQSNGLALNAQLAPGTYIIGVSSWSATDAATIVYNLTVTIIGSADNPPPLTVGAAPAIQIRPATNTPANPPGNPPGNPPQSNPPQNNQNNPPNSGTPPAPPVSNPSPPQVSLPTADSGDTANGAGGAAGATGDFSAFSVIPSNLLLTLGSGPAGGVQGLAIGNSISFVPDRVTVRATNPALLEGLVRMTILTPASQFTGLTNSDGESAEAPTAVNTPTMDGMLMPMFRSWQSALDALFDVKEWLRVLPGQPTPANGPMSPRRMDVDGEDFEPSARVPGKVVDDAFETEDLACSTGQGWIGPLAALGAVAFISNPRRRRPQQTIKLRREVENEGW